MLILAVLLLNLYSQPLVFSTGVASYGALGQWHVPPLDFRQFHFSSL